MPPDAAPVTIRAAYRDLARRLHPDRAAGSTTGSMSPSGVSMAAVNEAYRVLADPGRRAVYDRSLRTEQVTPARPRTDGDSDSDSGLEFRSDVERGAGRATVLAPDGPARVPWRLMAAVAAIGSGVVLVSSFFDGPAGSEPPDGILQPGSCVAFELNGDVREVSCGESGGRDVVVDVLVPLDATCPGGTVGHRDRLGLGIACITS